MIYEEDENLKKLQEELEWVKYRIKMLDIMERKLLEMKRIAQNAGNNISIKEREELNKKIKYLESQIKGIDEESRYI
ncbi:hypothetical protein [Clostridium drakei]|uniref:Uncharacterized protein n=1 Tax=Clostridium drakei TaxID=332101 RepID=A0A2U8DMP5_9CLOT|nr:hypothetical protein [Clostridium drakei]AWI03691.1 hypothetical protein B9W14_04065 [Clostridium drakei]